MVFTIKNPCEGLHVSDCPRAAAGYELENLALQVLSRRRGENKLKCLGSREAFHFPSWFYANIARKRPEVAETEGLKKGGYKRCPAVRLKGS